MSTNSAIQMEVCMANLLKQEVKKIMRGEPFTYFKGKEIEEAIRKCREITESGFEPYLRIWSYRRSISFELRRGNTDQVSGESPLVLGFDFPRGKLVAEIHCHPSVLLPIPSLGDLGHFLHLYQIEPHLMGVGVAYADKQVVLFLHNPPALDEVECLMEDLYPYVNLPADERYHKELLDIFQQYGITCGMMEFPY